MTPSSFSVRDIVTPVTAVTFVVSTVTGIMLLLHWYPGWVRFSHEWLSVVFSAIAIWHLVRNWKYFTAYLSRRPALSIIGLSAVASLVFTIATGGNMNASPGAVFRALGNAPLSAAAPAFGIAPENAVALLKASQIDATGEQTIRQIAKNAGMNPSEIVTILATNPAGKN